MPASTVVRTAVGMIRKSAACGFTTGWANAPPLECTHPRILSSRGAESRTPCPAGMAAIPDPPPFSPVSATTPAQTTDLDRCWKRGWRGTHEALGALMSPDTIIAAARPPAEGWRASHRLCRLARRPARAAITDSAGNADNADNAEALRPQLEGSPRSQRSRDRPGGDVDDADSEFIAAVRACWCGDAAAAAAYMRKVRRLGLAGSVRRIPATLLGQLQEAGEVRGPGSPGDGGGAGLEAPPSAAASVGDGSTPLHVAAARGHAAVCEVLLDGGHPIDAVSSDGFTPLLSALLSSSTATTGQHRIGGGGGGSGSRARHGTAVEVLLREGADPDCLWAPCTPLQVAAAAGLATSLAKLLEAGAEPGGRERHELGGKDAPPLSIALHCGHMDCAELLRQHGADQRQRQGRRLAPAAQERASARRRDSDKTKAATTLWQRPASSLAAQSPYAASLSLSTSSYRSSPRGDALPGSRLSKNAPRLSRHPRARLPSFTPAV
jgi:hypothetical protein